MRTNAAAILLTMSFSALRLALGVPADTAGESAPATASVEISAAFQRALERLSDESFEGCERAMMEIAAFGDPALPLIERAETAADTEAGRRLRTAALMIRWRIPAEVSGELAPLWSDYASLPWIERQRRLRAVSAAAWKLAIPSLMVALNSEKDERVQRTVVRILASRNMWPEGMSALREANVQGIDLSTLLDPRVLISIGNAFLSKGDYERALREYERAIELAPNEPIVLYNIGCIHALKGQPDEAFDFLMRSIKAGYRDEEWLRRDPDLKSLHDDPRFAELSDLIHHLSQPGAALPEPAEPELPGAPPADEFNPAP